MVTRRSIIRGHWLPWLAASTFDIGGAGPIQRLELPAAEVDRARGHAAVSRNPLPDRGWVTIIEHLRGFRVGNCLPIGPRIVRDPEAEHGSWGHADAVVGNVRQHERAGAGADPVDDDGRAEVA